MEEDLALPEESDHHLIAENGSNGLPEVFHHEAEDRRHSKASLLSKESVQSKESLLASSESLLNEEDEDVTLKSNGVISEVDGSKDEESQEDKEAIALKKRMWVAAVCTRN